MTHHLQQVPTDAPATLAELLVAMRGELIRFLAARRVAADEAEDLIQDLFLTIEKRVHGPVHHPRAYLYRMLDNLLLDRRRGEMRRVGREQRWAAEEREDEADELASPERQLIARERLRRVALAIQALPERTGLILRRFRIEGVAQAAIAQELGVSVSAVEKHLQKAYQAIAAADGGADGDYGLLRRPLHEQGSS